MFFINSKLTITCALFFSLLTTGLSENLRKWCSRNPWGCYA